VGVVREVGGGPEQPDFAGYRTGRRGPSLLFLVDHVDSSSGDDPGSRAKSKMSLAHRGRPLRYGAMVRSFGDVRELMEKKKKRGTEGTPLWRC
jgi:hypothetical protein